MEGSKVLCVRYEEGSNVIILVECGGEILYQLFVAVKQITPTIGSLEPQTFVISQSLVVGNLGTI